MLGMHCFEGLMGSKLIGQRARLVRASQRTERDDHGGLQSVLEQLLLGT